MINPHELYVNADAAHRNRQADMGNNTTSSKRIETRDAPWFAALKKTYGNITDFFKSGAKNKQPDLQVAMALATAQAQK